MTLRPPPLPLHCKVNNDVNSNHITSTVARSSRASNDCRNRITSANCRDVVLGMYQSYSRWIGTIYQRIWQGTLQMVRLLLGEENTDDKRNERTTYTR